MVVGNAEHSVYTMHTYTLNIIISGNRTGTCAPSKHNLITQISMNNVVTGKLCIFIRGENKTETKYT